MRPDFSLIWGADNAPFTPIEASDYTAGWVFRTGAPPRRVNFDYFQNLSDQRTAWLAGVVDSVRIDVASATTVDLTTAAPDTRGIRITGTTTINGFTAVAGATYFVTFSGALTLTNSASLVTQSGANIITAAGDTCIIRATAANVVEVMVYVAATVQSLAANGYRKFKDGMIIQWVSGGSTTSETPFSINLPITFPTGGLKAFVSTRSDPTNPNASDAQYQVTAFSSSAVTVIYQRFGTIAPTQPATPDVFIIGY